MTLSFGLPAELAELADEYELLDELGRGGTAIVYRARDRALGRDVAIKVVHPRATSPDDDAVARLAREARTVAQLHHAGIVAVYAVRRLSAGGLALVMQLVPGLTLKGAIQRDGPFGADRAEAVLRDVAAALAYAHARQIVHRDVKPENIFLDADTGRALLADFGIARSGGAESLTMTGTAIGTPFYMSPEQVDGKPVDGRSDVYSLGLVAWEMLTGLRPWDGESLYHVIYKQKHDDLPPIEALRRDVPRRLQYVVERMLQKHPAARWPGAGGLLAQLDDAVLPTDYGQWQASLPDRVTRHRAVAGVPRVRSLTPDPATLAAATVRFASGAEPLGGRTEAADARGGPSGTAPEVERITAQVLLERATIRPAPHEVSDAGQAEHASVAASLPHTHLETGSAAATPLAYETMPPTWAAADPNAPRRTVRRWGRRAGGAAALSTVVLGGAALTSRSRDVRLDAGGPTTFAALHPIGAARRFVQAALGQRWTARDTATSVAAVPNFVESTPDLVGVGDRHLCNVTFAGTAQCWGKNDQGQLGDGSTSSNGRLPHTVLGVMRYSALGAGVAHTCGVTTEGDVYCWGANDSGQLGDGTTLGRSAPVRVAGTGTYRAVRGGRAHTCALDVAGRVRCWGTNDRGQLGDGTRTAQVVPTLVALPERARATAVATGDDHSCALLSDGRVVCWGANSVGQLGRVRDAETDVPTEVPGVRASAIAAGESLTCVALLEGPVRCWGRDRAGQQGAEPSPLGVVGRQTSVLGGEDVRALAVGATHTCALTSGGWAWCWGRTRDGVRHTASRVGRGPYLGIAAGAAVSCAVPRGRVPECWGGADGLAPRGDWARAWGPLRALPGSRTMQGDQHGGAQPQRPTLSYDNAQSPRAR